MCPDAPQTVKETIPLQTLINREMFLALPELTAAKTIKSLLKQDVSKENIMFEFGLTEEHYNYFYDAIVQQKV